MHALVKAFEKEVIAARQKEKNMPSFKAGDTINVHLKILEGNKERIQQFQGIVIQRRSTSRSGETFSVRKLSGGVGVQRVFPLHSPFIEKIEVLQRGRVRRARLFYLKGRSGKAARVKEKL